MRGCACESERRARGEGDVPRLRRHGGGAGRSVSETLGHHVGALEGPDGTQCLRSCAPRDTPKHLEPRTSPHMTPRDAGGPDPQVPAGGEDTLEPLQGKGGVRTQSCPDHLVLRPAHTKHASGLWNLSHRLLNRPCLGGPRPPLNQVWTLFLRGAVVGLRGRPVVQSVGNESHRESKVTPPPSPRFRRHLLVFPTGWSGDESGDDSSTLRRGLDGPTSLGVTSIHPRTPDGSSRGPREPNNAPPSNDRRFDV